MDLVILIERGPPDPTENRRALEATIQTRGTHALLVPLSSKPAFWAKGPVCP